MKKKIKIERWANFSPPNNLVVGNYRCKVSAECGARQGEIQVLLTGEVEIEVPEPEVKVTPSMIDALRAEWMSEINILATSDKFADFLKRKLFGDKS
jgi:hypothetical protein